MKHIKIGAGIVAIALSVAITLTTAAQSGGSNLVFLPVVSFSPAATATTPVPTPSATSTTPTPAPTDTPGGTACSLFQNARKLQVSMTFAYAKPVTSRTEGTTTREVKVDRGVKVTFSMTNTEGNPGVFKLTASTVVFQDLRVNDYQKFTEQNPPFTSKVVYSIAPVPQNGLSSNITVYDDCQYAFGTRVMAMQQSDPASTFGNFNSNVVDFTSQFPAVIPAGATKLSFSGAVDAYCNGQPKAGADFSRPAFVNITSYTTEVGNNTCWEALYVEGKNSAQVQLLDDKATLSWEIVPVNTP